MVPGLGNKEWACRPRSGSLEPVPPQTLYNGFLTRWLAALPRLPLEQACHPQKLRTSPPELLPSWASPALLFESRGTVAPCHTWSVMISDGALGASLAPGPSALGFPTVS